eukprot:ANDGO_04890.mRNA.1 hypothetical protein
MGVRIVDSKVASMSSAAAHSLTVHTEDSAAFDLAALFIKPKNVVASADLATGLGVELTPTGLLAVTFPFNETNVKGVYAAGDCANPVRQLAVASGDGNRAGAGLVMHLTLERQSVRA